MCLYELTTRHCHYYHNYYVMFMFIAVFWSSMFLSNSLFSEVSSVTHNDLHSYTLVICNLLYIRSSLPCTSSAIIMCHVLRCCSCC